MEQVIRMPYARFKQHYADCATVAGSYDAATKSIMVVLPEGRGKPSGTRGRSFLWLRFQGTERSTGRSVEMTIQAIDRQHAIAKLPGDCDWVL